MSEAELARRVGVRQSTMNALVRGESQTSRSLWQIARELETTPEYLLGQVEDPSVGTAVTIRDLSQDEDEDDDTVEIDSVDVGYGMGGTYLDAPDAAVEVEKLRFTRTFLRNFTPAPPEMLFVATGHGDSMNPTIQDSDVVLVDRSDREPKMRDKIWAMSMGGIGMIKRLRPQPDGTMIILSDNRDVPEDRATDGELFIHGRVVAIVRKV